MGFFNRMINPLGELIFTGKKIVAGKIADL
jgi:hypothetical protein